jgi:anthranilate synthase component 2
MLLIIDNYDSFTYNLYQFIAELEEDVRVFKNDQISLKQIEEMSPTGIILSPGPGRPEESGICLSVIETFKEKIPILGVCLGHQAIGIAFGSRVNRAPQIVHGKDSLIFHSRKHLFKGLPLPFKAGRYHSLIVDFLPDHFILDAETPEGLIMGMHHREFPLFGVQFHPESVLTPEGKLIIQNFLEVCHAR